MIYLSGSGSERLALAAATYPVGLLIQPGNGYRLQLGRYRRGWAADNGCFAKGDAFEPEKWIAWLANLEHRESCLFAVAPDVLYDAQATIERSAPWLPRVRDLGYRAAFVGQDGAERISPPWDDFDTLFIGGSDLWKLGSAAGVAAEARRRGKWVHMGRVNSLRRLRAAVLMGCDSADGNFLGRRARKKGRGDPATRGLPELLGWLAALEREPFLPWLDGHHARFPARCRYSA